MKMDDFVGDLSLSRLGSMANKGYVLAIRPGRALLVHETDRAQDILLGFEATRDFVRAAGYKLKWLPRYSWYENGTVGYLNVLRCRPDLLSAPAERFLETYDFFSLVW